MIRGCFMAIVFDLQHYRSSSRSAPCRERSREWLCRAALLMAYSFSFTDSFAYNQSATFLNILKVKPPYSRISIRSVYFLLGFCIRRDASEPCPTPVFRYLKGQFIVDTALHTVQLLIMRTLQSSQCKKCIQFLENPHLLIQWWNRNK